jgi:hypothetical protein
MVNGVVIVKVIVLIAVIMSLPSVRLMHQVVTQTLVVMTKVLETLVEVVRHVIGIVNVYVPLMVNALENAAQMLDGL